MSIGPLQLIVLGVSHPDVDAGVRAELARLRAAEATRLVDALVLTKDTQGELEADQLAEADIIATLIGLDITDRKDDDEASVTSPAVADLGESVHAFDSEEEWDVVAEMPNGSVALLLLFEHRWAVPLREAMTRAGAVRIADGFVSPLDLADIGLLAPREAQQQHAMETARSG